MGIANKQRLRESLIERIQRGNSLRQAAALLIRRGEIVSDVVANVPCVRLGTTQWINGLGKVAIEKVGITDRQPGQRAGVFCAVLPRKRLNSRIRLSSTVLQKLLRHGLQSGRRDKSLMDSPKTAAQERNIIFGETANEFL